MARKRAWERARTAERHGRDALTVASWNVNSFAQRADDVEALFASEDLDVLFVCETLQRRLRGLNFPLRFEGEVISVCQMKGCWMRLSLPEDKTVMVRFKDYGFFVPKDIAGKKVVVEGKAFVSEVSEEERKHLAEDAGQEDSLKTSISGPEIEMGLEATGVRIFN